MTNNSIPDLHILSLTFKDYEIVKLKKVILATKRPETMVTSIFLLPGTLVLLIITSFDTN